MVTAAAPIAMPPPVIKSLLRLLLAFPIGLVAGSNFVANVRRISILFANAVVCVLRGANAGRWD
jgi:hypothetical protein